MPYARRDVLKGVEWTETFALSGCGISAQLLQRRRRILSGAERWIAASALRAVMLLAISVFVASGARADAKATPIGDAQAGEILFEICAACHEVGAGAENAIGPHLNGIFGRRAGSVEDFSYSRGLIREGNFGLVWQLDKLDAYLENPKALVSDTRMNFDGMADKDERDDVLAYLRRFSDSPQNIPEASPTARKREVELPPEILKLVGDPEYGEYLANECTTCHQRDGEYDGIPSIISWPEEDFIIALHAYKTKIRPHPVMQMMAGRLTDEEIAALAAYFGRLE